MPAVATYRIALGDTRNPLNAVIYDDNGSPLDLTSLTVTADMETSAGVSELSDSAVGITKHPTQAFTLDATNNWIYAVGHGWQVGDVWVPATTGSLSGTGLTAATRYKVVERDVDWVRVSLRSDGAPVTIAGAGTGTHTAYIVGSVQHLFAAAQVDTAGVFYFWFRITESAKTWHWPLGQSWIEVRVEGMGN